MCLQDPPSRAGARGISGEPRQCVVYWPQRDRKDTSADGVGAAGYRVLFRPAVTLATELEVAHKELRLPRLLANYRRFDLILVDELGYLPFAKPTAEVLFQFFSDRYERASVALTSNLAFAQWTQVFGNEQMTAALLDRLVHRSHILTMEGESFRFRQSLQKQDPSS